MNAPANVIGHDAAAGLLQLTPDQLTRLVGAGVVRRASPGKYAPAHLVKDYIAHLHREPERRERAPTQVEIAEHLDMSDRNLRDVLAALGLDHKVAALSTVRVGYIRHLREQAAGRMGGDGNGLDLVQERAALAREMRLGHEIKNEVARKTYGPITLLAETLALASQAVVERFEQLPAQLKRTCPELSEAARDQVMSTIAAARNEWVERTRLLVTEQLAAAEDELEEFVEP